MSRYTLHLSKHSSKFLKKHPALKIRFVDAFRIITTDYDKALSVYGIKKLRGAFLNTYRLRIGKYRAIFRIINSNLVVYVIEIGARGDIYK